MESIRYSIVEKAIDIPLQNPAYPGLKMSAYKTCFSTWIAEHAVIHSRPLAELGDAPLVRINSACFTADIFGDQRCDCRDQLLLAMSRLRDEPGLILYHLHHEGRGLGLTSKLNTYKRMLEEHESTFEAMRSISNRNDLRTYGSAILILQDLGIRRLRLMSNNPIKKLVLEQNGFEVVETVGVLSDRPGLDRYLQSKRAEQGHYIDFDFHAC